MFLNPPIADPNLVPLFVLEITSISSSDPSLRDKADNASNDETFDDDEDGGDDETFVDDEDAGDDETFDVPDPDDAGGRLDASDKVGERGGWDPGAFGKFFGFCIFESIFVFFETVGTVDLGMLLRRRLLRRWLYLVVSSCILLYLVSCCIVDFTAELGI